MLIDVPNEIVGQVMLAYEIANKPIVKGSELRLHHSEMLEHLVAEKVLELIRKEACKILSKT